MTDRVRIRVSLTGKEPAYELMVEGRKVRDMSWEAVQGLATWAIDILRRMSPSNKLVIEGEEVTDLSWIEALELGVQATSTLRWVKH